jgi:hypothetical protein
MSVRLQWRTRGDARRTRGRVPSMGLYQLCYRVGSAFEGVVFLEATSLGAALWQAERDGIAPSSECDALELHPDDARIIPQRFVEQLLREEEVSELERILIAGHRSNPCVDSVQGPIKPRHNGRECR